MKSYLSNRKFYSWIRMSGTAASISKMYKDFVPHFIIRNAVPAPPVCWSGFHRTAFGFALYHLY